MPYLDDLMSIICVHIIAIQSAVEHLEIPPVRVERPYPPLLPLLPQIVRINPVEEGHHPPLATIPLEKGGTLIPEFTIFAKPVSSQPNLFKSLRSKSHERTSSISV